MFGILKKLFPPKKETAPVVPNNQELIEKLYELQYDQNLIEIINRPENKILLLNVYYTTFNDVLLNILSKADERSIASVNLFSFFKDVEDINYTIKRLIPIIEKNNINIKIIHDLSEVIDSIKFLKNLGEEDGE